MTFLKHTLPFFGMFFILLGAAAQPSTEREILKRIDVLKETRSVDCFDIIERYPSLDLNNDSIVNEWNYQRARCIIRNQEYEEAILILEACVEQAKELKDYRQLARVFRMLGYVYSNLDEQDIALRYARKGEQIASLTGDTAFWLGHLAELANIRPDEHIDSAIADYEFITAALKLDSVHSDLYTLGLNNLASLYSLKGDFEAAIAIYDQLEESGVFQDSIDLYYLHFNRGVTVSDFHENLDGMNEIKYALKLLNPSQRKDIFHTYEAIGFTYMDYGSDPSHSDSAAHYYQLAYDAQYQWFNDFSAEEVVRLREEFEAEQRESEIKQLALEKDLESTRKELFGGIAVALVLLIVASFYVFNLRLREQKLKAKQEIERLEKEKEVLALQSMLFAQEEERQRIARDLHDSIGALLSAASMQLQSVDQAVDKLTELNVLQSTREIIQNAGREIRRVSHNMMPGVLMKLGLEQGLDEFFESVGESQSLKTHFVYDELKARLENKQEVMIYRMLQEMTNNSIKHANASEIKVMLKLNEDLLTVSYKDDGVGFDASKMDDVQSFGLAGLKSRAAFIGASLKLHTNLGQGVHYELTLPLTS